MVRYRILDRQIGKKHNYDFERNVGTAQQNPIIGVSISLTKQSIYKVGEKGKTTNFQEIRYALFL